VAGQSIFVAHQIFYVMGQQKSFIKLKGEIGDLSFYKTQDGHLVRTKGGIDAHRIQHDAAFQRTRENGSEFGASGKAGKLLRNTVRLLLQHAHDRRVVSRLTKVMTQIKNADVTSVRGARTPGIGLTTPEGQAFLQGFDFNLNSETDQVLLASYASDAATGTISIPAMNPAFDIKFPEGATHFSLTAGMAVIDFIEGSAAFGMSDPAVFEVTDPTVQPVTLAPTTVPTGTGTTLVLLLIRFYQEVNGVQYALNNDAYNALSITAVA
jgi:hypothetical protein